MAALYRTLTGQSAKSHKSEDGTSTRQSLQRTTTTDPMTGTLNHLTADQLGKLDIFKAQLEKDGWWTPNGINGKPSHDDGTLLRYLRARKFDVAGAVGQFTDTEKWMKEQHVEELYEHFDVDFYERARSLYPMWTGRRDKRGIPIYVYEIKGLDSKNVSKYQKESQAYKDKLPNHKGLQTPAKLLPLFALYHNLLNMILPMCSTLERPNPEIPVTNSTNIVDISGVGLTQFWNLKQHMQDASVLATAHYPETLDRIFIIGAPAFFPTVWGWIKRWFDPVTVSKIFILSKNEVKPTLESFMDVKNIPKKYGGELNWGWGDLPDPGEAERKALETDGIKEWVRGPCLFLEHKRVAVGSENGKLRRSDKEVAELKPVLYAADYTEEPVHPERKSSSASSKKIVKPANGAALAPVVSASTAEPSVKPPEEIKSKPLTPTEGKERGLNVHNSPSGESQVHLPDEQPAPPAITAEYISPVVKPVSGDAGPISPVSKPVSGIAEPISPVGKPVSDDAEYTEPPPPTTAAESPAPKADQALHSNPVLTVIPPPGHTQPGPLSDHAVEMNRQIAYNLQGESISEIPASSDDKLGHPDLVVASDGSKGLVMEKDKLALNESSANGGEPGRPAIERFVTASGF